MGPSGRVSPAMGLGRGLRRHGELAGRPRDPAAAAHGDRPDGLAVDRRSDVRRWPRRRRRHDGHLCGTPLALRSNGLKGPIQRRTRGFGNRCSPSCGALSSARLGLFTRRGAALRVFHPPPRRPRRRAAAHGGAGDRVAAPARARTTRCARVVRGCVGGPRSASREESGGRLGSASPGPNPPSRSGLDEHLVLEHDPNRYDAALGPAHLGPLASPAPPPRS